MFRWFRQNLFFSFIWEYLEGYGFLFTTVTGPTVHVTLFGNRGLSSLNACCLLCKVGGASIAHRIHVGVTPSFVFRFHEILALQ